MRWKPAKGRKAVNTSSGENLGTLSGFVADPDTSHLVALVIGDQVIAWADAGGIGKDAVTIADQAMLRPPESSLEKAAVDGSGDPVGKRVITEDGQDIGVVADIDFDAESGAIRELVLGDDEVSGSRLLGIGSFAVMVSAAHRSTGGGQLDALSKTELYDMAKARDIDGRSSMTKAELVDALA